MESSVSKFIATLKHRFWDRDRSIPTGRLGVRHIVWEKHPHGFTGQPPWPHWKLMHHQTPEEVSEWGWGGHIYMYRCEWCRQWVNSDRPIEDYQRQRAYRERKKERNDGDDIQM